MADRDQKPQLERAKQLYENYGRPLEADHWGEYLVVGPSGEVVYGPDEMEVATRALARFGKGGFRFRIGPRIMGSIR